MQDATIQRAEEICYDAAEIEDAAARTAFVEKACAGDARLQREVLRMLLEQPKAEQFFRESSLALRPPDPGAPPSDGEPRTSKNAGQTTFLDEKPGTRIGSYKLLHKLGEGGCGAVYMAEQEQPVRRPVALKIIKLGMDTRNVIARFRAEQQALALMDHPNIAHVLDAGATETGRPYFVMELVRGIKLTTYCDQHHLDARQRLRLFIQICYAIQHAHQKGIIHRDIKPSNILVTMHDGVPVPKVIDFGIAKAIEGRLSDQTLVTPSEQFIGTPAYMSPEQAEMSALDVDTRSDIYSLGVLLYELLAGRTPFDTQSLLRSGVNEMRRTLREREPQRPSTAVAAMRTEELTQTAKCRQAEPPKLISMLRGDLDWIVMKALEKDRSRRYQTANGLAADIQRYLTNEPILARPPSRFYRLQKSFRRNRIAFAAGCVTVIALIASSAVSTWLLLRERSARERALVAEQQKGSLQKEADSLRERVESERRFSQALAFFKAGDLEKADAILDTVSKPNAAPEYASMYREIGDWHALNGRWSKAKERFDVLAQISELSGTDTTMDDNRCAALLVDQGYSEEYERFRESLISRYAGTASPNVAQRVVRQCLLTPANEELMTALNSFSDVVEKGLAQDNSKEAKTQSPWESYAMALMTYRQGNYAATLKWCQYDNSMDAGLPTRAYGVRLIEAMTFMKLGRQAEANAELKKCRSEIQKTFASDAPKTSQWKGFWFDRVYLQIHLREATALIEGEPEKAD